jgi:hypothetical protein
MSNKREWEKFEAVAARPVRVGSRVMIRQDGGIYFDEMTWREMGEPEAVAFLWEERTRTVGLQIASPDDQTAVMVRLGNGRRTNRVVRSIQFLRKIGVDITKGWRLPFAYVEDRVLVLELKTAVVCGARRWKQYAEADVRRASKREGLDEAAKIRAERAKMAEQLAAERAKLKTEREKARAKEREFEQRTREIERIQKRWRAVNSGE